MIGIFKSWRKRGPQTLPERCVPQTIAELKRELEEEGKRLKAFTEQLRREAEEEFEKELQAKRRARLKELEYKQEELWPSIFELWLVGEIEWVKEDVRDLEKRIASCRSKTS